MRKAHRLRTAWRAGQRKPADHLILARIPDKGISTLIAAFPVITGCHSGESRDPHVTLVGPFLPEGNTRSVSGIVEKVLKGASHLSCRQGDLIGLKGMRGGAIAFELIPGEPLLAFYQNIVSALGSRVSWNTWIDLPPGQRRFHISLRFNIPFHEFPGVWKRVNTLPESNRYIRSSGKEPGSPLRTYLRTCDTPVDLLRIAVMKRGFLWTEYDLPRERWLSRKEALDPGEWEKTRAEYRKREGFELVLPLNRNEKSPFVIADLHLGHRNIIDYCRRPFSSSSEMDEVLIRNWNYTVRPDDEIYFLGDLRHGTDSPSASHYLGLLSGRIRLVEGNHDRELPGGHHDLWVTYQGIRFQMIHDPEETRTRNGIWVIHGHHHNNHISLYPFINTETRTINVSAELINYSPVSLHEICEFIKRVEPGEYIPTLKDARGRYTTRD